MNGARSDAESPPRRRCAWVDAAVAALMLALALACLRPLWGQAQTAIPQGTQPAGTVPMFNLWTAWWNADRLAHGMAGYWQAPIFHPVRGAFAFSEPQPTLLAVAPLAWWGSPALAYNVYLLASLTLNGWLGYLLLRRLEHRTLLAAAGGVMCVLLPYVHYQLGVLQLAPIWGILWTLLALDDVVSEPTLRRGAWLGAAFGATYLMCNYHGLFLSVLLAVCGPVLLGRRLIEPRAWAAIGTAIVVAALLTGPVAWAQLHYLLEHRFARPAVNARSLSTSWEDYVYPNGINWLRTSALWPGIERRWDLSPGHFKTLLAAAGLLAGLWQCDRRRRTLFWGLLLFASVVLASSPRLSAGSWNLHEHLVSHWPGFAQIRSIYRFVVFGQIAVIVLAAEALAAILGLAPSRAVTPLPQQVDSPATPTAGSSRAIRPIRPLRWCCGATLALVAACEVCPPLTPVCRLPDLSAAAHWARWLRDRAPPADAVVCLPLVEGTREEAHEVSTRAMYYQMLHHHPLVEGYSGFFPQSYHELRAAMETFPGETPLLLLQARGARYCVVDESRAPQELRQRIAEWPSRLQAVYADAPRRVTIYELLPPHP